MKVAYFFYICKYLKLKVQNLNQELNDIRSKNDFNTLPKILHSLDALYREIDEFNTTYWSKFLLIIWLFFGTLCVTITYICIFGNTNIMVRILFFYIDIAAITLFDYIFSNVCSLNLEANKTYSKINSISVHYYKLKMRHNLRLLIKVITTKKFSHSLNDCNFLILKFIIAWCFHWKISTKANWILMLVIVQSEL